MPLPQEASRNQLRIGVDTREHYLQHTRSPTTLATSLDSAFPLFTRTGLACGASSNA